MSDASNIVVLAFARKERGPHRLQKLKISPVAQAKADTLCKALGASDLSELVATLIRHEHERRVEPQNSGGAA